MAGTIITDFIRADANKLSLNVGNTIIASVNALGILSNTGNVMISSSGTIEGNNVTYNGSTILSSGRVRGSLQPAGSVLQVVQTVKTDSFSTSSTSFVDVTGLSVAITPTSATSKILVIVNMAMSTSGHSDWKILRNGSDILVGDAAGSRIRSTGHVYSGWSNGGYAAYSANCYYLDSPSSTSALTYKVQVANPYYAYTIGINRTQTDVDATYEARTTSTITVMEIAQ